MHRKICKTILTALVGITTFCTLLFGSACAAPADGRGISPYGVYLELVEQGQFEGTYAEFLASRYEGETIAVGQRYSVSATSALRSTVSVYAQATYRSRFPMLGGGEETTAFYGSGVLYRLNRDTGEALILTDCSTVYFSQNVGGMVLSERKYSVYLYGTDYLTNRDSYTDEGVRRGEKEDFTTYAVSCTLVSYSTTANVAVLKASANDLMKNGITAAAELRTDEAVLGETCTLSGNAQGQGVSVSAGVLSVLSETAKFPVADRNDVKNLPSFSCFRTDAAAAAGSEGGGVFDKDGKLMGLVAYIEEAAGIVYCLPIADVQEAADRIIQQGGISI